APIVLMTRSTPMTKTTPNSMESASHLTERLGLTSTLTGGSSDASSDASFDGPVLDPAVFADVCCAGERLPASGRVVASCRGAFFCAPGTPSSLWLGGGASLGGALYAPEREATNDIR